MNNKIILSSLHNICNELESIGLEKEANTVSNIFLKLAQEEMNIVDTPEKIAWTNYARTLAKKDPDFIPPIKPKVSVITFEEITEKSLFEYHLFKSNKKELPKFTSKEEETLKLLAKQADMKR